MARDALVKKSKCGNTRKNYDLNNISETLLKGTKMTPDQITQLRQLLERARKVFWNDEGWTWYKVETAHVLPLIEKALALLPCPTCNGTKKVFLPESQAKDCPGYSPFAPTPSIPCPDCQPPTEKTCQKEGNCTRYMDGTCEDCPDYK